LHKKECTCSNKYIIIQVNNTTRRRILPRTYSRYNLDYQDHENNSIVRPLLQRQQRQHREYLIDFSESNSSSRHNSGTSSSSDNNRDSTGSSSSSSSDSSIIEDDDEEEEEDIFRTSNTNTISVEEAEEDEAEEDNDNTTITESFTRSRVDIYRLAIRTNSEILEDLAAIIRILRQINAIYRVFHNNAIHNNRYNSSATSRRSTASAIRRRRLTSNSYTFTRRSILHNDDDNNHIVSSDTTSTDEEEVELTSDDDDDEEANKLLEAGLEDLQTVLTMENNVGIKRQSTLALLALITYQYNHCSDNYLRHYLDPNGEYNPALAIFAAATYDEEQDSIINQPPKSCKDIIVAAEELYGPDWLDEFHKGKEGALRKMLEKLTFVAQIRLKVRDTSTPPVIR
jgi:hypothetical protein